MNKILFLLLFLPHILLPQCDENHTSDALDCIKQKLFEKGIISDPDCSGNTPVGNPYLYEDECHIALNRYLSRSINMEDLARWNEPERAWGWDCTEFYDIDPETGDSIFFPPPPGVPQNCEAPYDAGWGKYCPDIYCENIAMLVELEVSMVNRAATHWSHDSDMTPGAFYYEAAAQMVCDINAAFDCAGKRRPIIGAGIFESNNIRDNTVEIPVEIMEMLFEDVNNVPAEFQDRYVDGNSFASGLYFTKSLMHSGNDYSLEFYETQLWFLYLAKQWIDMGYTAIHMGQYKKYAAFEKDVGYPVLDMITTKIRNIAAEANTFVLLNGETNGQSEVSQETGRLIFDWDLRAIRPRELADPNDPNDVQVAGDFGCDEAVADPYLFQNTPCEGVEFPAIIDPCVIETADGVNGTISPDGCEMESVPYVMYFDFGSGISLVDSVECENDPPYQIDYTQFEVASPNSQSPSQTNTLTWGYEDTRWFSELIPEPCQEFWWTHFYCNESFSEYGHLQIPGILSLLKVENFCRDCSGLPTGPGSFMLNDSPGLLESIKNTLTPSIADINVDMICEVNLNFCDSQCDGLPVAPPGELYRIGRKKIVIDVTNLDCSSTYSIHIKDLTHNVWLPQAIGSTHREFYPKANTTYSIEVRQDNMALEDDTGSTVNSVTEIVHIDDIQCCELVRESECVGIGRSRIVDFKLSPNPISKNDILTIDLDPKTTDKIEIISSDGRVVKQISNFTGLSYRLELIDLFDGIYFIKATDKNQNSKTAKLIIIE